MTLLIRVDASTRIGTGHVMRCLALAQAWQEAGGDTCFVLAFHVPTLEARLKTEGMDIIHLDVEHPGNEEDAMATAVIAKQHQAQWIVVDGYHFDADYQKRLKTAGFQVLFIDDYGHAVHYYADVVLNQNIYAQSEMYVEREQYTQLLLGTKYALLRREFWSWQEWQRQFPEKARKILVTLGGSDPDNVTLTVIQALQQLPYDDMEAIILVGGQNPYYTELEAEAYRDNRIKLLRNVTNMPELMAWADVAISAGGSTNWELCFLGAPSLSICLAENQLLIIQYLLDQEIIISLGWYSELKVQNIQTALVDVLKSQSKRSAMSKKARSLIDGYGVKRISSIITNPWFTLQLAREQDSKLIWNWVNDPQVRQASFNTSEIPWESHTTWFKDKLVNPDCLLYIATNQDRVPIGQVRFDSQNEESVISVSLAPEFRGHGYASHLIQQAVHKLFIESEVKKITAYIKENNIASIRAFLKVGFIEEGTVIINDNQARKFCINQDRGLTLPC